MSVYERAYYDYFSNIYMYDYRKYINRILEFLVTGCFNRFPFSQELADYCKPFLLSIIYGYDIFARMNKSTISDFKWRLIDALSACKVPKHRLLSRGLFVCMRRCLFKWCLPQCFQPESSTTVGSDTLLLDASTQERLIYSLPQIPCDDDEMRIRFSVDDDTSNSGE